MRTTKTVRVKKENAMGRLDNSPETLWPAGAAASRPGPPCVVLTSGGNGYVGVENKLEPDDHVGQGLRLQGDAVLWLGGGQNPPSPNCHGERWAQPRLTAYDARRR